MDIDTTKELFRVIRWSLGLLGDYYGYQGYHKSEYHVNNQGYTNGVPAEIDPVVIGIFDQESRHHFTAFGAKTKF